MSGTPKSKPKYTFSEVNSKKLVNLYAYYDGKWDKIVSCKDFEKLKCTKEQAIQHLKYIRSKAGRKRTSTQKGMDT